LGKRPAENNNLALDMMNFEEDEDNQANDGQLDNPFLLDALQLMAHDDIHLGQDLHHLPPDYGMHKDD
jgi:hypothetical protein